MKYYTPTIDEFYVGFEYERSFEDSGWESSTYSETHIGLFSLKHKISLEQIRVKYLDAEDIKGLGWSEFENSNIYTRGHHLLIVYPNRKIEIRDQGFTWKDATTFFMGNLKNKSELKFIMKSLSIV